MEKKEQRAVLPPYAPKVVDGIYSIRHKVHGTSVSGDICYWDKDLSRNTAEFIIKACNMYQSLLLKAEAERWHFVLDEDQIAVLTQFQEHLARQRIVKTERETFDLIFREFASVFFSDEDQLGGRTAEDLVERLRRTSFQHYAATRRGDVTLHA